MFITLFLQTLLRQNAFSWACYVAVTWIQNFWHTPYFNWGQQIVFSWQYYIAMGSIIFNEILHLLRKNTPLLPKKEKKMKYLFCQPAGLKPPLPALMSFLRPPAQLFQVWRSYSECLLGMEYLLLYQAGLRSMQNSVFTMTQASVRFPMFKASTMYQKIAAFSLFIEFILAQDCQGQPWSKSLLS